LDAHRARSLLGARAQLVGMRTRLSNMIRGVLKTFGMWPGSGRGQRFDRQVDTLIEGEPQVAMIVRPLLETWRHLGQQIACFDRAVQRQVRADATCRLLMTVPGIGALSSLAYVSTVEDPERFSRSRAVGAHLGLILSGAVSDSRGIPLSSEAGFDGRSRRVRHASYRASPGL